MGDESESWRMRLRVKDNHKKRWRREKDNCKRWRRVEDPFKTWRRWKMSTRRGGGSRI